MLMQTLNIAYQYTKFDNSSFSPFQRYDGGPKFKMGHVTLTTIVSGVICHAGTCYKQHMCQILSLYLRWLQDIKGDEMWKMGRFGYFG